MENLKKVIILLFMASYFFLTVDLKAAPLNPSYMQVNVEEVLIIESLNIIELAALVDCTINIKVDGLDIEVTFHDVSWLQCTIIKIGKWLQDTF